MAAPSPRGSPWQGAGQAWTVIGTLLVGILVWGGVGLLADRLLGFDRWVFLPVGMVLGAGAAIYAVYVRHGRDST